MQEKGTYSSAKPCVRRKPHRGEASKYQHGHRLAQLHKNRSNPQQALLRRGWRKTQALTLQGLAAEEDTLLFRKGFLASFVQKSLKHFRPVWCSGAKQLAHALFSLLPSCPE